MLWGMSILQLKPMYNTYPPNLFLNLLSINLIFCGFAPLYMQIYGDPEAADVVFTCGADITVVGINITTQLKLTGEQHFSPTLYLF